MKLYQLWIHISKGWQRYVLFCSGRSGIQRTARWEEDRLTKIIDDELSPLLFVDWFAALTLTHDLPAVDPVYLLAYGSSFLLQLTFDRQMLASCCWLLVFVTSSLWVSLVVVDFRLMRLLMSRFFELLQTGHRNNKELARCRVLVAGSFLLPQLLLLSR